MLKGQLNKVFIRNEAGNFLLKLILFVVLILISGQIIAQETCIPPAVGVPFINFPAPKWWNDSDSQAAAVFSRIDDPRWKQAASITFGGSGALEHVSFRALHHDEGTENYLYLSFWVKVSPVSDFQTVYIGLMPPGGGIDPPILIKVWLTGSTLYNSTSYEVEVYTVQMNGCLNTPVLADPAWTDSIRVWANNPPGTWAIHIPVPIGTDLTPGGFSIADDFHMWFEVLQNSPGSGGPVIEYAWPRGSHLSLSSVCTGAPDSLPPPPTWPLFGIVNDVEGTACEGGIIIPMVQKPAGSIHSTVRTSFMHVQPIKADIKLKQIM
jgi:hypothetical protein